MNSVMVAVGSVLIRATNVCVVTMNASNILTMIVVDSGNNSTVS